MYKNVKTNICAGADQSLLMFYKRFNLYKVLKCNNSNACHGLSEKQKKIILLFLQTITLIINLTVFKSFY